MRTIYQSLFYKVIVTGGIIVAITCLVKDLFFSEEVLPTKSIAIWTTWLLVGIVYWFDVFLLQKKYRIDVLMYLVFFVQIMLPIIYKTNAL